MPLATGAVRFATVVPAVPRRVLEPDSDQPIAVLLLPRALDRFILRDQAQDLLKAPGVVAVEPARVPVSGFARLPDALGAGLAAGQARRMRLPGVPRVVVIFHPLQYPLAVGLLARYPECELWYSRWDRYEEAEDANPKLRRRIVELHEAAAGRAALTFCVSDALARIEREAGREPTLVPLAADSFPAPDPSGAVIALSLGHLGRRCDWALLRAVAEGMEELTVLLVGARHDDECADDPDYAACRAAPNLVWLGARDDEEAARLILCADIGLVPFKRDPFNDAGLPYRILKYARLGRRTIAPDLAGVRTWDRAVTVAPDAAAWIDALRAARGTRTRPDLELREWALAQTARSQNRPLFERLEALGIATGRLGSERAQGQLA